jgi:putative nucleotidyltransferase with HDIG domain
MKSKDMLAKLDRLENLPTLPPVAMQVNRMLLDPETSTLSLSRTIEKDQAITANILKLVNSAFFGLRSRVGNIPHALMVLGFNAVRNAILSLAVVNAFPIKKGNGLFDVREFWKHSIAVAVTSKHLAERGRFRPSDDSFTAGLLHDVGKLVLSQYFQDLFEKVWERMLDTGLSFAEAEKTEVPVHHGQIGGYLANKWHLPLSLVETIQYHHAPRETVQDPALLMLVHAADVLVNECRRGFETAPRREAFHPSAWRTLEPALKSAPDWFPSVSEETASAAAILLKENGNDSP